MTTGSRIGRSPWFLLRDLFLEQRPALTLGLLALVAVDLCQLYIPRFIKFAVDDLTQGRADAASLLGQAGSVLLLALFMAGLRVLWRPLVMGFARRVERDLRIRLFDHLQRLHLGYYADHPPGELMARATSDLNNIRMATGIGLVAAADGLVLGLAALGFLLYISPLLTALALAPLSLIVILTRTQSRRLHRSYQEVQAAFAGLTEQARETLSSIRLVKSYALMDQAQQRLEKNGRGYLELNLGLARLLALFFPVMVWLTSLSLAVVLGVGGGLTVLGRITTGDFVAFTAYLALLTWPMMALGWVVSLMQRARASLGRVAEVLDTPPGVSDPEHALPLSSERPLGLSVRGLTFAFPGQEEPALKEVSLEITPGQATALVGRVGSGKSALLALLGRLYQPPPGTIFLNGADLALLRQDDLRAALVQVPQEAFIFSDTVRANLALGRPQATEDELWRALTAAEFAEEARALSQGLETLLGERGLTLSGGQRQRLCLARALLVDPEVLILDDPLSAVDTQTEARILANLHAARAGRTTLLVSHRLASVAFCQTIYVLDQGRMAQQGRHAEMLTTPGLYQNLFAEQALLAEVED